MDIPGPLARFLSSRSGRIGLALFVGLCIYVPLRVERPCPPIDSSGMCGAASIGYGFLFTQRVAVLDVEQWLLQVLALAALVALAYSWERRT